jgi:hypothetical protein
MKIPYKAVFNAALKFCAIGNDEQVLLGFCPNSQNCLPFQAMNDNLYVMINIHMFSLYFNGF